MAGIWWLKFLYMARASGSHVYRVYKMWGFSLLLILPLLGVFCNLLILRMVQRYLSNLLALIHSCASIRRGADEALFSAAWQETGAFRSR
jgi:hypothetical protein